MRGARTRSLHPSAARMRPSVGRPTRWIGTGPSARPRPSRSCTGIRRFSRSASKDRPSLRSLRDDRNDRGESVLLVYVHSVERGIVEQSVERQRDRGRPRRPDGALLFLRGRGAGFLLGDRGGGDHCCLGRARAGLSEATSASRAPASTATRTAVATTPATVGIPSEPPTKVYDAPG